MSTLHAADSATASGTVTANEACKFIVHLVQAFEIQRQAQRATAEEKELIDRQVPVMLEEARCHVLSIFDAQRGASSQRYVY